MTLYRMVECCTCGELTSCVQGIDIIDGTEHNFCHACCDRAIRAMGNRCIVRIIDSGYSLN